MYVTEVLFEQAKKAVKDNRLVFIEEIVSFLPCRKNTFYEHFPTYSDEYKELSGMLEANRTTIKAGLRAKWYKGNSAAAQIALYRLICTKEENRALSMQHVDVDIPENTEIKISIKKSSE